MSVYLPNAASTTYIYKFVIAGVRHKGSTHQTTKADAAAVEAKIKEQLRHQAGGLRPSTPIETPTFTDWAEIALTYQAQFIKRADILERTIRMVLAFWGAAPTVPIGPAAVARPERVPRPYHGLRLGDPIADPQWLERFETWMAARGVSGSTRNSYLSACSDLYTCALQPQFRATTGITMNPFAGIRRSPTRQRLIALTPAQILDLVTRAGRHIAHALCIAALAPKLRVSSILALEWATHLDADLTTITVGDHKTSRKVGAQTVPISAQLRQILRDIRAAQDPPSRYVIVWRDQPVASIKTGLRRAVTAAGLTWGLKDGVTFHVMRHSVATILANPQLVGALTERLRADVMGHLELRTTQQYTHLATSTQAGPHESLSAALPGLRAAVAQKTVRPAVRPIDFSTDEKDQQNRVISFSVPRTKIR
jgi:integrase